MMNNNTTDRSKLTPLQRAAIALKEMRIKLDAVEKSKTEAIAIVGMSCRFPGGANSSRTILATITRWDRCDRRSTSR